MTCRGRCSRAGPGAELDGMPMVRALQHRSHKKGHALCRHCGVIFQAPTARFCPCCSRRLSRRVGGRRRAWSTAAFGALLALAAAAAVLGGGTYANLLGSAALAASSVAALAAGSYAARRSARPPSAVSLDQTIRARVRTFRSQDAFFVALESRIPAIARLREFSERRLLALIPHAGVAFDAERAATRATRIAVLLFVPAVAVSAVLAAIVHPAFAAGAAAPAGVYLAPYFQLRMMISERRTVIEEEMAFFLCYVNIMQTIGQGIYHSFDQIRGAGIFPGMERDASEIVKRVKMMGITQNESIAEYGAHHPSELFRNFITGYLAKIKSIGNVPSYTSEKAKFFFAEYVGAWKRYEKSATEIFSAVMMISIIMPMMIMFSSMIGTPELASTLLMAGTAISPFIAIGMVFMLNKTQPVTGNKLPFAPLSLPVGFFAGVGVGVAGVDPATTIASAFLAGALYNRIVIGEKLRSVRAVDTMLPEYLRDVTEMSKTGENISQITIKQSAIGAYKGEFGRILRRITASIAMGEPFDRAVSHVRHISVQVRFVFFLLGRTYSSGAANPDIFNSITEFASSIHQTKEGVTKSLRSLSAIVYASPFLMLGIAHMMIAMFSGGDAGAAAGGGAGMSDAAMQMSQADIPFLSSFGSLDESFVEGIAVMAALSCIPIGAVAAKITSYTVKDTMPIVIVSAMVIAAVHALPVLFGMFDFGGTVQAAQGGG